MIKSTAATNRKQVDMGLTTNIEKLPPDNISDWRNGSSNMGPSTRANTIIDKNSLSGGASIGNCRLVCQE